MVPSLRSLFLGSNQLRWRFVALLAFTLFAFTFAAYAVGLFSVTGGVVFIPGDAAVVGVLAASGVGYDRRGLLISWIFAYTSLLGFHADHVFLGLSHRSLTSRLGSFLALDGLGYFAIQALILGTIAFGVGIAVSAGIGLIRRKRISTTHSR